ncbi:MAG: aldehyde dehydrogenase family protein, partial [Deltaproteobacteria bacterium]
MNLETLYEKMEYGPAPESPNNAEQWLKDHQHKFSLFINGKWTESSKKNNFESINPATGKSLASISEASEQEVDQAVKAAKKAFESWSGLDPHQRSRFLYAMARQMQKHARLLAVLETLDNGKTIRETRDIDVPLAVRHFYHHAGWAQLLDQEFKNHQPLGVVGQIIPWNFPLLMLAWKVAPALAAGNTVVL